jgi:mannose-1-phosphate guanylyltransferase
LAGGKYYFPTCHRDTAAGVLLPLAHITHRDPLATVAVFPSDHFIADEGQFMDCVWQAIWETKWFPQDMTLLGVTPDRVEEGFGWIEPEEPDGRYTLGVRRFWEKPPRSQDHTLDSKVPCGILLCVAIATALWRLVRDVGPDLYADFPEIRQAIGTPKEETVVRQMY